MARKPTHEELERKVKELEPGAHLGFIYEGLDKHQAVVTPFLRQGLERREKVLYIVDALTAEKVLSYLRQDGLAVEPYLESGQLVILTADESYTREAIFDPDGMVSLLENETERALVEGYSALRVTGEMTWALGGAPGSDRLMEYEAKLNEFFLHNKCLAICQYDRRRFEPEVLLDVLTTHPIAIVGTEVFENFYYLPPEDFLGPDPARARLNKWLESLAEKKKAGQGLRESESRYRLLAENVTDVIWTTDMNLQFTYVSPSITRMLGYNVREVVNQMVEKILTPASRQVAMVAYDEELAKEKMEDKDLTRSRTLELELVCKDGSTVWTEAKMTFLRDPVGRSTGILGVARDIAERKRAEEALRRHALIFGNIHDGIVVTDSEGRIIDWNPAAARMFGYSKDEVLGKTTHILTTEVVIATLHDGRWSGEIGFMHNDGTYGVCETIVVPLQDEHKNMIATVGVMRDVTERKGAEEGLRQNFKTLETSFEGTLNVLGSVAELRDPYTAGHQRCVTELACAIAKEMDLSEEQIEGIRVAGIVHDIGKISIPSEVLTKPSQLTATEYGLIKAHAQVVYDLLRTVEFPWPVAQIVLQHHERMDGSGYPGGLSGDAIILEARILAVADVLEAMASDRPYRLAHGIDKALEEISQNKGVLYDPEVVEACLKLLSEKGFTFKRI